MTTKSAPAALDRKSVREADRIAIQEYGVPGIVLMENAARAVLANALDMLQGAGGRAARIHIYCGSGNNGGDGYALARHVHNAGMEVLLAKLGEPARGTDAATNRSICGRMGLREIDAAEVPASAPADLVVDALFGTGLDRPVTGAAASVIERVNSGAAPILAVDVPSGLDCDTGRPLGVAVRAARTVTFLARKLGFLLPGAAEYTGQVIVADIGAPREIVERLLRARSGDAR